MAMGESSKARTIRFICMHTHAPPQLFFYLLYLACLHVWLCRSEVPAGVPECRELIARLVLEARQLYAGPALDDQPSQGGQGGRGGLFQLERCFFMRFSQGAMLALDTALAQPSKVGGVVLLAGFLMNVETWALRLKTNHADLRVLQIHGLDDWAIPFETARWLQGLLQAHSTRVIFVPHGGGHTVSQSTVSVVTVLSGGGVLKNN